MIGESSEDTWRQEEVQTIGVERSVFLVLTREELQGEIKDRRRARRNAGVSTRITRRGLEGFTIITGSRSKGPREIYWWKGDRTYSATGTNQNNTLNYTAIGWKGQPEWCK